MIFKKLYNDEEINEYLIIYIKFHLLLKDSENMWSVVLKIILEMDPTGGKMVFQ